jgi:hypothetical protein
MVDPSMKPYVDAVTERFHETAANRKALGAVMLASASLHTSTINRIGQHLYETVGGRYRRQDLEFRQPRASEVLKDKWGLWKLIYRNWPENCSIGLSENTGAYRGIIYGVHAPDPNSDVVRSEGESGS